MSLYDAFEALDYGSQGGVLTLEAAKETVDDSLTPCVLSKPNGEILHVNEAWTNLCGFSQSEACGQTFAILQGPSTDWIRAKAFVQHLHAFNSAECQLVNYTKDGTPFVHCISSREPRPHSTCHIHGALCRAPLACCALALKPFPADVRACARGAQANSRTRATAPARASA